MKNYVRLPIESEIGFKEMNTAMTISQNEEQALKIKYSI